MSLIRLSACVQECEDDLVFACRTESWPDGGGILKLQLTQTFKQKENRGKIFNIKRGLWFSMIASYWICSPWLHWSLHRSVSQFVFSDLCFSSWTPAEPLLMDKKDKAECFWIEMDRSKLWNLTNLLSSPRQRLSGKIFNFTFLSINLQFQIS